MGEGGAIQISKVVFDLKKKKQNTDFEAVFLVNIGQFISASCFHLYKVYVIKNNLWLPFCFSRSSNWVADLASSTESSVFTVYTYYDEMFLFFHVYLDCECMATGR